MDLIAKFSVIKSDDINVAQQTFQPFLLPGENIDIALTNVRDKVVFTDRKIICLDVQGLTGSKKEFKIFPYSKISSYSVETAGTFDTDGDFKIWISGVGVFEIKMGRSINISAIGQYLCSKIY